jgi:hypothetical protein
MQGARLSTLLNRIRNTTDGLLVISETLRPHFFNLIKVEQKDAADLQKASSEVSRDLEYFLEANMTKREFEDLLVLYNSRDMIFLQKKLSDCENTLIVKICSCRNSHDERGDSIHLLCSPPGESPDGKDGLLRTY